MSVKALNNFLFVHLKSVIMKCLNLLGKCKRRNSGEERSKTLQTHLHGTDLIGPRSRAGAWEASLLPMALL